MDAFKKRKILTMTAKFLKLLQMQAVSLQIQHQLCEINKHITDLLTEVILESKNKEK